MCPLPVRETSADTAHIVVRMGLASLKTVWTFVPLGWRAAGGVRPFLAISLLLYAS